MTSPDRDDQALETLVANCLERMDCEGSSALESLCRQHPEHADELRKRVGRLQRFGMGGGTTPTGSEDKPDRIGPYRLRQLLGEGGMGSVYLAEQESPVRRRVALKLIKLGMDSKAIVARFEQERQALALMQHDGIARVYDCGTSERGQPYFVMELVKGIPLTVFCDQSNLALDDRLELMRQVCAAVTHAHQKGVVHRDLKPSNVLVSDEGGKVQVKIIDFGLAKAMGSKLIEATLFTEAGRIVGTPEYMAPEQAVLNNADIDTRADVYSLGVMLYEMLVGALPFSGRELRGAGDAEMQRILREVEPPKPSTRLSSIGDASSAIAHHRRLSVHALHRALKNDLDWVVLKALEKDRNRRYDSANALAADLARYLDQEPLAAGPPSATYRLKKLVCRYRTQLVVAGLITLVLLVGAIATFAQYLRAEHSNRRLDMLAAVIGHDELLEAVAGLKPVWPEQIPALQAWLRECDESLTALSEIEATFGDLRDRAATGPERDGTPTRVFASESERRLYERLARLARDIDALHGVRSRVAAKLAWAERIAALTLDHPNAPATWGDARDAIARADGVVAHKRYAEQPIDLRPQTGLVPIGMNPATGLWEFYHLRSAWCSAGVVGPAELPIPSHRPDGSIPITGDTGIVFVLLPGGKYAMGAEDGWADEDEKPVRTVTVGPCFLARHEVTQGQWRRLTDGEEPSHYRAGHSYGGFTISYAHPVEQVSRLRVNQVLAGYGLELPTEAQWEYGCRAGTATVFWTGDDPAGLDGIANVADQTLFAADPSLWGEDKWFQFDDGFAWPAPVGAFRANAFGLFDVYGNVWEWCRDPYLPVAGELEPGTGLRLGDDGSGRAPLRGGDFTNLAHSLRSSHRSGIDAEFAEKAIGGRAARSLLTR